MLQIWFEVILASCMAVLSLGMTPGNPLCPDEDCQPGEDGCGFPCILSDRSEGHRIVGVLLAFLVVFRSQIAWDMFLEGRHVHVHVCACMCMMCMQALGACGVYVHARTHT